jgi:hypothetical protein
MNPTVLFDPSVTSLSSVPSRKPSSKPTPAPTTQTPTNAPSSDPSFYVGLRAIYSIQGEHEQEGSEAGLMIGLPFAFAVLFLCIALYALKRK